MCTNRNRRIIVQMMVMGFGLSTMMNLPSQVKTAWADEEPATEVTKQALVEELRTGWRNSFRTDEMIASILDRYGKDAEHFKTVEETLNSPSELKQTRSFAASVLGSWGGEAAREVLIKFVEETTGAELTYDDAELIGWVIKSIGRIGDTESLEYLQKLAGSEYWNARLIKPRTAAKSESQPNSARDVVNTMTRFRECALNAFLLSILKQLCPF